MQILKMDFQSQSTPPVVPVMQSDAQSRFIGIALYDGGAPYAAPENAAYTVQYHGPGPNNIGWYDTITLSSGTRKAVTVDSTNKNIITLELAEQALRVNGNVFINICVVTSTGYMLHTFPILCRVTGASYIDPVAVRSFFYVTGITSEQWITYVTACQDAQKRAEDAAAKLVIDSTLTQEGKAADAKAAGEAVCQLKEDINNIGLIKEENKVNTNTGIDSNNTNVYWLNFNAPINALASNYVYLTLDFSSSSIGSKVLIFSGTKTANTVTLNQIETFDVDANTKTFKLNGGLNNMVFGFHGMALFEKTGDDANASSGVVDYNNNVSTKKVGDTVNVITVAGFKISYSYVLKIDINMDAVGNATINLVPKNVLEVDKGGTKKFTTIAEAVTFAKTIASKENPITVIVYPGIYNESIIMHNSFISLIGINKQDCIIINDKGGYNDSPVFASGNFYLANLTIKATHDGTPNFVENRTDDYTIGGYGLHIDDPDYSNADAKIGTVENCIIYSAQNQAIGMGMAKNCKYIIRNCELINDTPDRMYELYTRPLKTGALGCHRGYFDGSNYHQILEVSNCILKVNKGVSIQLGPFTKEGTGMEEHFYNNMLWSGTLGKADSSIGTYSESPYTSFELSGDCYGNNVSALNK